MRWVSIALVAVIAGGGSAAAAPGDPLVVTGDGVNVRFAADPGARVRMRVYRGQPAVEIERAGNWVHAEIVGAGRNGWIHESLVAPGEAPATVVAPAVATAPVEAAPVEAAPVVPAPAVSTEPDPLPTDIAAAEDQIEAEIDAASEAEEARERNAEVIAIAPAAPPADGSGPIAIAPGAIEPAANGETSVVDLQRFRDSVDYLNSRTVSVAGVDLFTEVEPIGADTVQIGATEAWNEIPPAGQQSYINTLLDRWAAARGREGPARVQIIDADGQVLLEQAKP